HAGPAPHDPRDAELPMVNSRLRLWLAVHSWSSLIATIPLLFLCLTGLPLIFHDELDALIDPPPATRAAETAAPAARVDDVVARAVAADPGSRAASIGFYRDTPFAVVETRSGPGAGTPTRTYYDMRDGRLI